MWKIQFRGADNLPQRMVFVFDDEGTLRWSGQSLLQAFRELALADQAQVEIDVDSAIWFLGPVDVI